MKNKIEAIKNVWNNNFKAFHHFMKMINFYFFHKSPEHEEKLRLISQKFIDLIKSAKKSSLIN